MLCPDALWVSRTLLYGRNIALDLRLSLFMTTPTKPHKLGSTSVLGISALPNISIVLLTSALAAPGSDRLLMQSGHEVQLNHREACLRQETVDLAPLILVQLLLERLEAHCVGLPSHVV